MCTFSCLEANGKCGAHAIIRTVVWWSDAVRWTSRLTPSVRLSWRDSGTHRKRRKVVVRAADEGLERRLRRRAHRGHHEAVLLQLLRRRPLRRVLELQHRNSSCISIQGHA